jgi:hypothetical protein
VVLLHVRLQCLLVHRLLRVLEHVTRRVEEEDDVVLVEATKNFVNETSTTGSTTTGLSTVDTGSPTSTTMSTSGSGGSGGAGTTGDTTSTTVGTGSGGASTGAGGKGGSTGTAGAPNVDAGSDAPTNNGPINVLVFNHTAGYGHQSRQTSIPLFQAEAAANNINFDLKYAHVTPIQPEGTNDASTPADLGSRIEKVHRLTGSHDQEVGAHGLASIVPSRGRSEVLERDDHRFVDTLVNARRNAELLFGRDHVGGLGRVFVRVRQARNAGAGSELRLAERKRCRAVVTILLAQRARREDVDRIVFERRVKTESPAEIARKSQA